MRVRGEGGAVGLTLPAKRKWLVVGLSAKSLHKATSTVIPSHGGRPSQLQPLEVGLGCCVGGFCNWGNGGAAAVIRNLGNSEEDVKNPGKDRGYVGSQDFRRFGKESIRAGSLYGVEGFEDSLCL